VTAIRPSRRGRWWQAGAVALAAGLTVVLSQNTTGAVFTGQTADTGNQVTANSDFCSAPGRVDTLPTTGYPTVDTGIYQTQATTNYSTTTTIGTISSTGAVARSLIKFTLMSKPSGCVVASAVLTMRVANGTAGSTITVFRAAAAWNPTTVTWNTDPGIVAGSGTSTASAVSGTVIQWNVATQVTALYAGPDYGFEVRDAAEGVGNNTQLFDSMEATTVANRPQLVITWG
jgi:hypothetical protein